MAVIIRRSKPITIKRRVKNREHDPGHIGTGWVYIPGFPPDRLKAAYHCIEINGVRHAFLWDPRGQLGEGWTCGKWSCSAGVMAPHNYMGECTIVYRSPSTPGDNVSFQRKYRK
jgi:hypothetical protein